MKRPFWVRELQSDVEMLRLNLADPKLGKVEAVRTALQPQIRLARGIHSLGMALLKTSTRLDWACPSSFEEFYADGLAQGRRDVVRLLVTPETRTNVFGPLLLELGMPIEDVLGHLETDIRESSR